jgi:TPR repeat protein
MRATAAQRPAPAKPAAPAAVADGGRPGGLAEAADRSMLASQQPQPSEPARGLKETMEDAARRGDADAQYRLGRMYLDGKGGARNPAQAAKWLHEAAVNGQYEARAELGRLLLTGGPGVLPPDIPNGLMWLKLAVDAAPQDASGITELFNAAWRQATENERSAAMVLVERWRARGDRPPPEGRDRPAR